MNIADLSKLAALGVALAAPTVVSAGPIEDVQLWNIINVSGSITDTIVFAADGQIRLVNNVSRVGPTLVRGSIGVKATKDLTLSLGYAHQVIDRVTGPATIENRIFQQLGLNLGNALGGQLTARTRFEQRFTRRTNDVGLRFRQQLKLVIPVAKSETSIIVSGEVLYNLNSTDAGARAGIDQIRPLIGISIPFNKKVSVEAAYQPIFVNGATRDLLNHTIPLTLVVKF